MARETSVFDSAVTAEENEAVETPTSTVVDDAAQVDEPTDAAADQPAEEIQVSLSADSELEAPVAVSVPGLDPDVDDLDEYGRLVLSSNPVSVSARLKDELDALPYVEVRS